jgi:hypothetical protein
MILYDYDATKLQKERDGLREKLAHTNNQVEQLLWVCGGHAFGRDLLGYGYPMETNEDWYDWQRQLRDKVMEAAEKVAIAGRAYCPLCGCGATDWGIGRLDRRDVTGERGWSIWAGLEMHLEGSGRTNECSVWKIAVWRLHNINSDKFNAASDAALQEKQARLKARLASEPTILVSIGEFALRAQPDYSFETPRADWGPIERELREAEFQIETTDNWTAYKRTVGDQWLILADPRRAAGVTFRVFKRIGKGKTWSWKSSGAFDLRGFKNLASRLAPLLDQRGIK